MDLTFKELNCPACKVPLIAGHVQTGMDIQMVKRCYYCDFKMIIVIPNEDYNYRIEATLKATDRKPDPPVRSTPMDAIVKPDQCKHCGRTD